VKGFNSDEWQVMPESHRKVKWCRSGSDLLVDVPGQAPAILLGKLIHVAERNRIW